MRRTTKHAVETLLVSTGITALARSRRRSQALVLAYHNIVPDGQVRRGDLALHLSLSDFCAQMDILVQEATVVPLRHVIEEAEATHYPRVAITFDDAYAGALELGLPELRRRGLPATFFVAPGCLGAEGFWWDRLAPETGWPAARREELLAAHAGIASKIFCWAEKVGLRAHPALPWHRVATQEEVLASACDGLDFGAHSWSHPNLSVLGDAELDGELVRPLEWLRDRVASVLPWLAYPYGRASPTVARAARRAGYEGALLVSGGWLPAGPVDRFFVPRWNVPAGLSLDGFRLRLAGLFCR